jgi:hypothetical protein
MKLQIPIGSEINKTDNNIIKIRIINTRFFVEGERKKRNNWDLFLIDPQTTYKELIKENMTTKAFAILTNMTLKTPFPYVGKRAQDSDIIIRFINKIIRINNYEQRKRKHNQKRSSINRKSSKI